MVGNTAATAPAVMATPASPRTAPPSATAANWARDAILMAPFAFGLGAIYAGGGVIMGQALANVLAGLMAGLIGWRFVRRMGARSSGALDAGRAST